MNYTNIIFDLDSTLTPLEGIDELGALKHKRSEIETLTNAAMNGEIELEDVFLRRLEIIQPTRHDLQVVGSMYARNPTPFATETITSLRAAGARVWVVTGGYSESVLCLTRTLGIPDENVFANEVLFDSHGQYAGINTNTPLWKNLGKKIVVEKIRSLSPGKAVMIGDGMSDWEAAQSCDHFVYFGGYVYREKVAAKADTVITGPSLQPVLEYLLRHESQVRARKRGFMQGSYTLASTLGQTQP